MKSFSISLIALFASAVFATSAVAQGRHDDRAHGYDKAQAEAIAAGKTATVKNTGSGGRHDEKPHATAKRVSPATAPKSIAPAETLPNDALTAQ